MHPDFLIGCIFDLAYLLLNFVSVLVLVCCTGVVFSLHRLDPDGVENETLSTALKFGRYPVMILCGVFAVTHGRLLMLVLSTLFFAGIVAVHAFIREHET